MTRQAEGFEVLKRAAETLNSSLAWADYGSYASIVIKDFAVAVDALRKAIELDIDEPALYRHYASALQKSGADKPTVAKIAEDVAKRFPSNSSAMLAVGAIYRMVGAKQQAEASIRSAIELDGNVVALLELGRLLQNQPSRMLEAEEAFRRVVADSEGMHVCGPSKELAELLVHRGEDEAATAVLKKALEENEECYCCTVAQAEIAARSGDNESARTWYEAAIEIREDGIQALTGLSRIVERDEAKKLIERALSAGPRDARCLLARAQSRDGEPEFQIKDASEALRLRPSFIEAHLFLISLLVKRGEIEEAFSHLKAALIELPTRRELIPAFVDAAMAIAASGEGERVSHLIEEDSYGSALEPLTVALKLKRGEKPVVAKEVMAVAEDIAGGSSSTSSGQTKD